MVIWSDLFTCGGSGPRNSEGGHCRPYTTRFACRKRWEPEAHHQAGPGRGTAGTILGSNRTPPRPSHLAFPLHWTDPQEPCDRHSPPRRRSHQVPVEAQLWYPRLHRTSWCCFFFVRGVVEERPAVVCGSGCIERKRVKCCESEREIWAAKPWFGCESVVGEVVGEENAGKSGCCLQESGTTPGHTKITHLGTIGLTRRWDTENQATNYCTRRFVQNWVQLY